MKIITVPCYVGASLQFRPDTIFGFIHLDQTRKHHIEKEYLFTVKYNGTEIQTRLIQQLKIITTHVRITQFTTVD